MKKILLVDDHPLLLSGISRLLELEPDLSVCGSVTNKADLHKALGRTIPDAVILDISLGARAASGLDMIPDIHSICGQIPVLILSMLDESVYGPLAMAAGASGYVSKHAPIHEVVTALRGILTGGGYFNGRALSPKEWKASRQKECPNKPPGVPLLSPREFEVFRLLGEGLPPRDIAQQLHLSVSTVEVHRANIRQKLDISSAAELTHYAIQWRTAQSISS